MYRYEARTQRGLRCGQGPPARRAIAEARTVYKEAHPCAPLENGGAHADTRAEPSAKSLVTIAQRTSLRQQKNNNRRTDRKNGRRSPIRTTNTPLPWPTVQRVGRRPPSPSSHAVGRHPPSPLSPCLGQRYPYPPEIALADYSLLSIIDVSSRVAYEPPRMKNRARLPFFHFSTRKSAVVPALFRFLGRPPLRSPPRARGRAPLAFRQPAQNAG